MYLAGMAFFGLLVVLDQFTKYAAETYLKVIVINSIKIFHLIIM